jgi:hypothetical protein
MEEHLTRSSLVPLRIPISVREKPSRSNLPPIHSTPLQSLKKTKFIELGKRRTSLMAKSNQSESDIVALSKIETLIQNRRKQHERYTRGNQLPAYTEEDPVIHNSSDHDMDNTTKLLNLIEQASTLKKRQKYGKILHDKADTLTDEPKRIINQLIDRLINSDNLHERERLKTAIDMEWNPDDYPVRQSMPVRPPTSAMPVRMPTAARPTTAIRQRTYRVASIPIEVDVTGNGNCLYYAIYEALKSIHYNLQEYTGREDFNTRFRQSIVKRLKANKENLYESGQFQIYSDDIKPHIIEAFENCETSMDIDCVATNILDKLENSIPRWIIQAYINLYVKTERQNLSQENFVKKYIDAFIDGVNKNERETTGIEEEMAKAILVEDYGITLKLITAINHSVINKENTIYLINVRNHWKYIAFESGSAGGSAGVFRKTKKRGLNKKKATRRKRSSNSKRRSNSKRSRSKRRSNSKRSRSKRSSKSKRSRSKRSHKKK